MTPKEKALELINEYYDFFNTDIYDTKVFFEDCKKCALIAVDKIEEADWFISNKENWDEWKNYWQEVKQEIEKL